MRRLAPTEGDGPPKKKAKAPPPLDVSTLIELGKISEIAVDEQTIRLQRAWFRAPWSGVTSFTFHPALECTLDDSYAARIAECATMKHVSVPLLWVDAIAKVVRERGLTVQWQSLTVALTGFTTFDTAAPARGPPHGAFALARDVTVAMRGHRVDWRTLFVEEPPSPPPAAARVTFHVESHTHHLPSLPVLESLLVPGGVLLPFGRLYFDVEPACHCDVCHQVLALIAEKNALTGFVVTDGSPKLEALIGDDGGDDLDNSHRPPLDLTVNACSGRATLGYAVATGYRVRSLTLLDMGSRMLEEVATLLAHLPSLVDLRILDACASDRVFRLFFAALAALRLRRLDVRVYRALHDPAGVISALKTAIQRQPLVQASFHFQDELVASLNVDTHELEKAIESFQTACCAIATLRCVWVSGIFGRVMSPFVCAPPIHYAAYGKRNNTRRAVSNFLAFLLAEIPRDLQRIVWEYVPLTAAIEPDQHIFRHEVGEGT